MTYTEEDMDYIIKINMALIERFKEQLWKEFGTSIEDINTMFKTLYKEQNNKMPLKWYEYGYGKKEEGVDF